MLATIRYAIRATTLHYTRAAISMMAVVGASPAVGACYPASEWVPAHDREIEVTTDGETYTVTVADLLAANSEDPDYCATLLALPVGGRMHVGGGADAEFVNLRTC